MRTPSLLGIALLCLSAMAAAMGDDYLSNFPKMCGDKRHRDWYQTGRYCIRYFNTPRSFSDAEVACRQTVSGGRLVSVHNKEANKDVLAIVLKFNSSSPRTWLGGYRVGQVMEHKEMWEQGWDIHSNTFIWTDGSLWNFEKWVPGQPDHTGNIEDCVEMNWKNLGEWNDVPCNDKKPFICAFKRHKWQ